MKSIRDAYIGMKNGKELTSMKIKWKFHITRAHVERALILCASALVVALALRQDAEIAADQAKMQTPLPVSVTQTTPRETVKTVVYYQDGEGYLVPVARSIEKTDGVAKATLNLMVASGQNDLAAARLGLRTTIPEGTKIDLDIANGKARVDLSGESLSCNSTEQEHIMVSSIAQTLCRFDTVREVSFLFDGQIRSKLTYGTDVSGAFTASSINLESVETLADAGTNTVQLYFPSASGRMLVPVTRAVYSDADMTTALLELAKGPKSDSGLEAPLPKDCGLLGVTMKNGVVTVNFTKQFMTAVEQDDGMQTLRAVIFTAAQFPGVKEVKIAVEGKAYTPPAEAQTTFVNLENDIVTYYPGVIEMD